jgi:hypothetical protein
MKWFIVVSFMSLVAIFITSCASPKSQDIPTPSYVTYYFPVYYPSYYYAPFFDQYYQPSPTNNNFNYYGYYGYWGNKLR